MSPGTDGGAYASRIDGWNPDSFLRCIRCGSVADRGQAFAGCLRCSRDGVGEPLEVAYAENSPVPRTRSDLLRWLAIERQPIEAGLRVNLGRPAVTPLVPLPSLGSQLFGKNETVNPTWGHKDRLHEVAVGVARLMGCRGIVAFSTGNHGAAAAAHASAAGMRSVIFCHPQASTTALKMISAYGGQPVHIQATGVPPAIAELVDAGWFPATGMDPLLSGRSNPYGAEGYKDVAYEVVAQLGQSPGSVIVPTASGDTLYGIAKGFAEVSAALDEPPAIVYAAQPAGADPLVRSLEAGHFVRVAEPHSMALSVADGTTGRHAMEALVRWGGSAVAVQELEIAAAVIDLAHQGLLVEPASAVALAAFRSLRDSGRLTIDRPTVLILTGAGVKWPQAMSAIFPGEPLVGMSALRRFLATREAEYLGDTGVAERE